MEWVYCFNAFFSGAFLANAVPHFVHGISGDKFPTPFAKPPGKGLSSPTHNVIWALLNLVIGYELFGFGEISRSNPISVVAFFLGTAVLSIVLSVRFQGKHKEE